MEWDGDVGLGWEILAHIHFAIHNFTNDKNESSTSVCSCVLDFRSLIKYLHSFATRRSWYNKFVLNSISALLSDVCWEIRWLDG